MELVAVASIGELLITLFLAAGSQGKGRQSKGCSRHMGKLCALAFVSAYKGLHSHLGQGTGPVLGLRPG